MIRLQFEPFSLLQKEPFNRDLLMCELIELFVWSGSKFEIQSDNLANTLYRSLRMALFDFL